MVIDEKILIREMKYAWGHDGYVAAREEHDGDEWLKLVDFDWIAEIEWGNVPNKVLGLIVEHLGDLPQLGEAVTVRKKESNTTIFNMVNRFPAEKGVEIHRLPLWYRIYQAWQKNGNDGVEFVRTEAAELLMDYGRQPEWVKDTICLEGNISRVAVCCVEARDGQPVAYAKLALSERHWDYE